MKESIEKIKSKLDIVDFINTYVPLKKAGRNYKANCPFHDEKTPSFMVSPDRQIWHCFGSCSEGGDVISFFQKIENITFFEALEELSKKTGVRLELSRVDDDVWNRKKKLITINAYATKLFSHILLKEKIADKAREYLTSRKITTALIKTFDLGYAPLTFTTCVSFLKKKGFSDSEISQAGLSRNQNQRVYDRFRDRIMFPLKDVRGNTLGFSGRLLESNEKTAKYVNTPETAIYHKRETLYGIHIAKKSITKQNRVIIVEGEFDMISCYREGVPNVVAIKGSAFTRDQLQLLKRFTKRVTLALDADASGLETTKRALDDAEQLEFQIDVAVFENGKDPDESINNDAIAFKKELKQPIPLYDFIIQTALTSHKTEGVYAKKAIADEVIPYITRISNPILLEHYKYKLARTIRISQEALEKAILQYKQKDSQKKLVRSKNNKIEHIPRYEFLQQFSLALLFQSKDPYNLYERFNHFYNREFFSFDSYRALLDTLDHMKKKGIVFSFDVFVTGLPPQLKDAFNIISLVDTTQLFAETKEADIEKVLLDLNKHALKYQIKDCMSRFGSGKRNEKKISQLSGKLAEIEKKIALL